MVNTPSVTVFNLPGSQLLELSVVLELQALKTKAAKINGSTLNRFIVGLSGLRKLLAKVSNSAIALLVLC